MNIRVQGSGLDTCCRKLSSRCECLVILLQPHAVWKLRVHPQGEVLRDPSQTLSKLLDRDRR